MGLYERVVFPCICELFLSQSVFGKQRREVLATAYGNILEIGFGTGLNLSYYPACVREITAIDRNSGMTPRAKSRIRRSGIKVDLQVLDCEHLPYEDESFDCVISTWTLCSIETVNSALAEIYRVLKPGGRFLFLEHGLSPDPKVQKWQQRLNGLEMRLGGGCRLNRNIKALVAAQPFAAMRVDEFYLGTLPKTHSYIYRGLAQRLARQDGREY